MKVQAEKTKGVFAFGGPGSKPPKVPAKRTVARPASAAPGLQLPAFFARNQKKPAALDDSEAVLVTEAAPKQAQGSRKRLALIGLSAAILLGAALIGKTFLMPADPAVLATLPADTASPATTAGKPGSTPTSLATPAAAAAASAKPSSSVPKKPTPTTVPSGTATPASAAHATEPPADPSSTGVTDALVQPDPALSATFGKTTGVTSATSDASPRSTSVAVQTTPSTRLTVQRTQPVPRVTDQAAVSAPVGFGQPPQAQAPLALPSAPLPVQQAQRVTAPPITLPQSRYVPPAVMTGVVPLPVTPLPAPQPQGSSARAVVTYLAPGMTPRTTTNGTASGPLTLTRPGEAAITLTSPGDTSQTPRYLGYSETDTGRIAIVHLEGRDETVSTGQVIPGTSVKVMAVTPASLTLKNDGKTAVIPIEVPQ